MILGRGKPFNIAKMDKYVMCHVDAYIHLPFNTPTMHAQMAWQCSHNKQKCPPMSTYDASRWHQHLY